MITVTCGEWSENGYYDGAHVRLGPCETEILRVKDTQHRARPGYPRSEVVARVQCDPREITELLGLDVGLDVAANQTVEKACPAANRLVREADFWGPIISTMAELRALIGGER